VCAEHMSENTTKYQGILVGLGGLEPPTSPLSGVRSNHLSYRPVNFAIHARSRFRFGPADPHTAVDSLRIDAFASDTRAHRQRFCRFNHSIRQFVVDTCEPMERSILRR
jgi:hypothetical protein